MTEIKQHEATTPDATPADVHKKWTQNALTSSALAITGLVSIIAYAATLYSTYLNIPIETLSKISPATENAIHAKMILPVVTSVYGHFATIYTSIATTISALKEYEHYNE